jgi:YVTN family beta-propeller protein
MHLFRDRDKWANDARTKQTKTRSFIYLRKRGIVSKLRSTYSIITRDKSLTGNVTTAVPHARRWRRRATAAAVAGSVVAAIATGLVAAPAYASVNHQVIYVTNSGNSVLVYDTTANAPVATIPVGSGPAEIRITPDGSTAYVANNGSHSISVIDTASNSVRATIGLSAGPTGMAISPDGTRAYVTFDGQVGAIDTATNTLIATTHTGNSTNGVAVTPDNAFAYVANNGSASVSVVATATMTVVTTIPIGAQPVGVAISPDGTRAYVADFGANQVAVINTTTNTVIADIPVGSLPTGVALTPNGADLYVTNLGSNTVSVIDTATNTVVATIPVGTGPQRDAVSANGSAVYVTESNAQAVSVISTATNTVTATVPVGAAALGVAELDVPVISPPTVSSISPASGPEAGGTSATITGTNFTGATAVDFGSTPATSFTVNSDTSITAVAPPGTDGVVDVTVTNPAGTSPAVTADQYTYLEPAPTITNVNPNNGALAGGTSVTITGTDFLGATAVDFGSTPATSFTVNSDTSITAVAPAASSVGTVDITVTTAAGTSSATSGDQYSYTFPFTGWESPVDNPPTFNEVNSGQAIPMKFSLGGNFGLGIIASGYPTVTQVSCTTGAPLNTGTLTDTAGGSGLQFDPSSDTYTYVWKTTKSMRNTCQEFDMRLIDGTDHTALFTFVK